MMILCSGVFAGAAEPPVNAPLQSALTRLTHAEGDVRRLAVLSLSGFGADHNPTIIPALIRSFHDDDSRVRRAAIRTLNGLNDPEAVPGLSAALDDTNPAVRKAAAQALGEFNDPSAIPALVKAMQHEDPVVRRVTTQAVNQKNHPALTPALIRAIGDPDPAIRQLVANTVGWLVADPSGRIPGGPSTTTTVGGMNQADQVREVLPEAFKITDPAVIAALANAVNDSNHLVSLVGQWLLMRINEFATVPAMIEATEISDGLVREKVMQALGTPFVCDAAAIPALVKLMAHQNPEVRQMAAGALTRVKNPQAVPELLNAVNHSDPAMRLAVVTALGRCDVKEKEIVMPFLTKALTDSDERIQAATRAALDALGELDSELLKKRKGP